MSICWGCCRARRSSLTRVAEVTRQTLLFHRESTRASELRVSDDRWMRWWRCTGRHSNAKAILCAEDEMGARRVLTGMAGEIRQAIAHVMSNAVEARAGRGARCLGPGAGVGCTWDGSAEQRWAYA